MENGSLRTEAAKENNSLVEEAEECQRKFQPFSPESVFQNMVSQFGRSKKELVDFVWTAVEMYKGDEYRNIIQDLQSDFLYWRDEQFRVLPGLVLGPLRNIILDASDRLPTNNSLRISTQLENNITSIRRKDGANDKDPPDINHKKPMKAERVGQGKLDVHSGVNSLPGKNSYQSGIGETVRKFSNLRKMRPIDITKRFPLDSRYSEKPTEPIWQRCNQFFTGLRTQWH